MTLKYPVWRCEHCEMDVGPAPFRIMVTFVLRHRLTRHRWPNLSWSEEAIR